MKCSVRKWKSELKTYNISSEIAPSILWDAAKATLRGHIISYSSYKNKERKSITNGLKEELLYREALHKQDQSEGNLNKLVIARANFNLDHSNYIKQKYIYVFKTKKCMNLGTDLENYWHTT